MKKMTITEHFSELRRRILFVLGFFILAFCFGWWVSPWVQEFITAPLISAWDDAQMLYTGITDALMVKLSLAMLVAIMVTVPVLLFQIWAFIAPGLHKNERDFIVPIFVFVKSEIAS